MVQNARQINTVRALTYMTCCKHRHTPLPATTKPIRPMNSKPRPTQHPDRETPTQPLPSCFHLPPIILHPTPTHPHPPPLHYLLQPLPHPPPHSPLPAVRHRGRKGKSGNQCSVERSSSWLWEKGASWRLSECPLKEGPIGEVLGGGGGGGGGKNSGKLL